MKDISIKSLVKSKSEYFLHSKKLILETIPKKYLLRYNVTNTFILVYVKI